MMLTPDPKWTTCPECGYKGYNGDSCFYCGYPYMP